MIVTLARRAGVFALLAALAAGCGSATSGHSAAPKPVVAAQSPVPELSPTTRTPPAKPVLVRHHHHRHHRRHMHAEASTAPGQAVNPIPQDNGGDQDADNNGGPSDGDGNV
jgi:hypothetical protein